MGICRLWLAHRVSCGRWMYARGRERDVDGREGNRDLKNCSYRVAAVE